jgi:plastocyanin
MYKLLILLLVCGTSLAQSVNVKITSNKGNPVNQVVVYLEPSIDKNFPAPADIMIMDQINSQFVPHILTVQSGTKVSFPNSDSIKHHVYSFSKPKTFELQLYKGLKAEPLTFGSKGEVELGCNVHDWMLGYIFIVDTPYFNQTNQSGLATLEVPEGDYLVKIWHPRIQDAPESLQQSLSITQNETIEFSLSEDLIRNLSTVDEEEDEFSDYD